MVGRTVSGALADGRLATRIICLIGTMYLQHAAYVPDTYANCHIQTAGPQYVQLLLVTYGVVSQTVGL